MFRAQFRRVDLNFCISLVFRNVPSSADCTNCRSCVVVSSLLGSRRARLNILETEKRQKKDGNTMKSLLQDMNVQNSYPLESGRPVGHTRMARGESTTNFRESRVAAEGKGVTPSKDPGVAIGMMNFQPVTKGTERNRTRENMNIWK